MEAHTPLLEQIVSGADEPPEFMEYMDIQKLLKTEPTNAVGPTNARAHSCFSRANNACGQGYGGAHVPLPKHTPP